MSRAATSAPLSFGTSELNNVSGVQDGATSRASSAAVALARIERLRYGPAQRTILRCGKARRSIVPVRNPASQ